MKFPKSQNLTAEAQRSQSQKKTDISTPRLRIASTLLCVLCASAVKAFSLTFEWESIDFNAE
jgi:hypothetical protein